MRVLTISHLFPNDATPVSGTFVLSQVKALRDARHECRVIAPVVKTNWLVALFDKKWERLRHVPYEDARDGIPVCHPRYWSVPRARMLSLAGMLYARGVRKAVRRALADSVDVVHVHTAIPDGRGYCLLGRDDPPFVVSIHGRDMAYNVHAGTRCRAQIQEVFRRAAYVIANSSKTKAQIDELMGPDWRRERCSIVYNGIDDLFLEGESPNPLRNPGSAVLVSVANLIPLKGHEYVLRALPAVLREFPGVRYRIVGDGSHRLALQRVASELGISDAVVFEGVQLSGKVKEVLAESDVFVLPSYNEGFGIAYLEAMAMGLPVIGVRGQGVEDFIEHGRTGILAEPKNVASIRDCLLGLLRDPGGARRMAEAGQRLARDRFTWQSTADALAGIYERVVDQARSSMGKLRAN